MLKRSIYISVSQPLRIPTAALSKAAPLRTTQQATLQVSPITALLSTGAGYSTAVAFCFSSPDPAVLHDITQTLYAPTLPVASFMPPTSAMSCPRNPRTHESREVTLLGPVWVSPILSPLQQAGEEHHPAQPSIPTGHSHPARLQLPVLSTKVSPGCVPPKPPPAKRTPVTGVPAFH